MTYAGAGDLNRGSRNGPSDSGELVEDIFFGAGLGDDDSEELAPFWRKFRVLLGPRAHRVDLRSRVRLQVHLSPPPQKHWSLGAERLQVSIGQHRLEAGDVWEGITGQWCLVALEKKKQIIFPNLSWVRVKHTWKESSIQPNLDFMSSSEYCPRCSSTRWGRYPCPRTFRTEETMD